MATLSENDLLIRYDPVKKTLVMYRVMLEDVRRVRNVIHTEYPMSKLKAMTINEAGRVVGEDILVSIAGTRDALLSGPLR